MWSCRLGAEQNSRSVVVTSDSLSARRQHNVSGFCLTVTPSRSKALLGEPVFLIVALQNCSSQDQRVRELLNPEFGLLAIWVQRPEEKKAILYSPAVRRDGRGKGSRSLAPGEHLTARVPIYFARGGWFLTEAGTYTVQAEYPIGREKLSSQRVTLTVEAVATPAEAAAAKTFMAPEAARFFFLGGGNKTGVGAAKLTRLTTEHKSTPWAAYARMALALNVYSGYESRRTRECPGIMAELETVLRDIDDPVFAADAVLVLVRCLRLLGQQDEADRRISDYFDSFSKAKNIPGLIQWLKEELEKR